MVKYSTVNAIPKMTSDTAPSGTASSSSVYSTNEAWKAFDTDFIGSQWQTTNSSLPQWVSYKFNSPISIGKYTITGAGNPQQSPSNWTFEGSNDGVIWDVLDTRTGESFLANETKEFTSLNSNKYLQYRVNITLNLHSTYVAIKELEMFEAYYEKRTVVRNSESTKTYSLDNKTLIHLPSSSDKNMILHGIESGKEIKLNEDFDKMKFVQDTNEVLGSGKVFTHAVDMSNTKVNKIIL